ncbi:MAG TPA: hypothetical protein VKT73_15180 [Xanthobacteraceae bacterium]|nr:hypothetical protein [Xanthobacteraceae bacterium]
MLVKLAREVAKNILPLEKILETHRVSPEDWDRIKSHPRFAQILEAEILAWETASNTHERTKMKAGALIEEWLPEANARLHDQKENLNAKVELGKLISRIAEMGITGIGAGVASGEKFTVTINLGADSQLKFEKETQPKLIEAEPVKREGPS